MEDNKKCSKCDQSKYIFEFIKNRNICKKCYNHAKNIKYKSIQIDLNSEKECKKCNTVKPAIEFIKKRLICKDCNNEIRRNKYNTDEVHRNILIQNAIDFKQKKKIKKDNEKLKTQLEIGIDNKICKYCKIIQPVTNYRHNRLKCKKCEYYDPDNKIKKNVRSYIYNKLNIKTKNTIEYLGCNYDEYFRWISDNTNNYTIGNHGKLWHIDHVIPLSCFDLNNEKEQSIAFNWRNTMPLSCKENLSKNNKINKSQIGQHFEHLINYHKKYSIEIPNDFIELFAKHLVAGNPLETSLPLFVGNDKEELG